MDLQQFLREKECFKFLKWVEIIQQENLAVKLDSMYILEKDKQWCDVIFIDGNGFKRKVRGEKGEPGDTTVINFEIDENLHLIMKVQTSTNLGFSLDDNGHLILNNN